MPALGVVIPTWNEAGNIGELVGALLALPLELRLWVMDDGSSDGTLELLDRIAASEPRLTVVRRTAERGYGRACADGIARALAAGCELVCQMDGDLSHDPRYLPQLHAAAAQADLVLGSRYVRGISVVNWSLRRLLLSTAANAYVRLLCGLRVRDCTTGYRLWRHRLLEEVRLDQVRAEGYSFLVEALFRAVRLRARVAEVPIIFVERKTGESKMSGRVILESALIPWRLLARRVLDGLSR